MQRSLIWTMTAWAVLTALAPGCKKSDEESATAPDRLPASSDQNVVARIDATVLAEPSLDARPVGTVLEGDLLSVLGEKGAFSKVNVRATGTTGWIDSNLCLHIPLSPYWEGDTSKAREAARKIYQDKFLVQRLADGALRFPVSKVKIEAAFNTLTFVGSEGAPKPVLGRKDAEALAAHFIEKIAKSFPDWKRPMIYVKGFDGQKEYLLTMGTDKKPHFL